jgi:hypothetical protein
MIAVLIILAVFSVPLTAIVASTYLKSKRLEAEGGGGQKLLAELNAMREETMELRQRVEVLETIATNDNASALGDARREVEEVQAFELAARRGRS